MIDEIRRELSRLGARQTRVEMDSDFAPETGSLVRIELQDAFWHMLPADFLGLLHDIPRGAGDEAVREAIEGHESQFIWHGPSPPGSRDT